MLSTVSSPVGHPSGTGALPALVAARERKKGQKGVSPETAGTLQAEGVTAAGFTALMQVAGPPMPQLCGSLPYLPSHGLLLPELPQGRLDAVGCTGEPEPRLMLPVQS